VCADKASREGLGRRIVVEEVGAGFKSELARSRGGRFLATDVNIRRHCPG
jgi:hypothetical protein